jgi:hypothetical protein
MISAPVIVRMPVLVSLLGAVAIGFSVVGAAKVKTPQFFLTSGAKIEKAPEPSSGAGAVLRVFRIVSQPPHRAQ